MNLHVCGTFKDMQIKTTDQLKNLFQLFVSSNIII